jgi:hypothetical protein
METGMGMGDGQKDAGPERVEGAPQPSPGLKIATRRASKTYNITE